MRALSATQVTRCEQGKHPRCRCRCQGVLHGAGRSALAEYFEGVGDEDPHQLPKRTRQLRLPPPVGMEEQCTR